MMNINNDNNNNSNIPWNGSNPVKNHSPIIASEFRQVFQSEEMKEAFACFLNTIFYQLDEKKVFALMDEILKDKSLTDEAVYKELRARIHEAKKWNAPWQKIKSLFVLKNGMGSQVAALTKELNKKAFHTYMEIYDRRYVKTIRKMAKFLLDGAITAVCNDPTVKFGDRLQAGALFSRFPYKAHEPLNDEDCNDPFLEPEKTHKAISGQVKNNSIDMVACLGGLHHVPIQRFDDFVDSIHRTLKPGGLLLFRDHNVTDLTHKGKLDRDNLSSLVSMVHTFVNAVDGVSWDVESNEVRNFKSLDDWTDDLAKHHFVPLNDKRLVLENDPTENAMMAFVKQPQTLGELREAISYRNDCTRPKEGSRGTWVEWANVRFSKNYADYIQDHHAHGFDYIGHLRQHWQHFSNFWKESLRDPDLRLVDFLFSDSLIMSAFILLTTTLQCSVNAAVNLPQRAISRYKFGEDWRDVCNLSKVEKFMAEYEQDYSSFIDHTPFYQYPYITKMKEMWKMIWGNNEGLGVKLKNSLSAISPSFGFIAKAIISAPIRMIYTTEGNQAPDTVNVLMYDPNDELEKYKNDGAVEYLREKFKDKTLKIEVIYTTPDGYKLVSMPRYKPFTEICKTFAHAEHAKILEIGSQKEISVDVMFRQWQQIPNVEGARLVYELPKLQDKDEWCYATYQVEVAALNHFQNTVGFDNIEYVHE